MPLQIVALEEKHLDDVAALVAARYRALRQQVPLLPPRYEDVGVLLPLLQDLCADTTSGVVAIQGKRLVGCLAGWLLPDFRGRRAVFSPEWANGAEAAQSRYVYEEMYVRLAARWVADGYLTHLVSMLPNDRQGMEGWHWLGFGMIAADGVRDLQALPDEGVPLRIRRGGPEDLDEAMLLNEGLERYLASAPTFLPHDAEERHDYVRWLADSHNALWLAYEGTRIVGFMRQGPASHDACTVIRDGGTTSIRGAFTVESARCRGVGRALLTQVLAWGRAQGYVRCAVDYEPMNVIGRRFWQRHFQPACYTLARQVSDRLAG